MKRSRYGCLGLVPALAWGATPQATATWSIAMADHRTGEVAVGTVTCLEGFDLMAVVPVVVVGRGTAAVQAFGDWDGIRRPIIFDGLLREQAPEEILTLVAEVPGHDWRQYGIVDTSGRAVSFTGRFNDGYAGGVVGTVGTIDYCIQGNVLTGPCVIDAIEAAIAEDGDLPARLLAGMRAARETGGDGRCSCDPFEPTACGCPSGGEKAGHIGGVIVARLGDAEDAMCDADGCADGDYFLNLNIAFQDDDDPDPVAQLDAAFDEWRTALDGRPDAVRSNTEFDPPMITPNGVAETTLLIALWDWRGRPLDVEIESVTVEHRPDSAGISTVEPVLDVGNGIYLVRLRAGTRAGVDRFRVRVDDGIRPLVLMPEPTLEYFTLGDLDGDRTIGFADLLSLLSVWGPCPAPPAGCPADLDGDGSVGFADLLLLLGAWT